MLVDKIEVGPLAVNCYLVADEDSRAGMIIDPGAEAQVILKKIKLFNVKINLLVLTHTHFDHIGALKEVKEATGAQVAVHTDDAASLSRKDIIAESFGFSYPPPPEADKLLADGDVIEIGSVKFKILHTPGHSPGSICLIGGKIVFTGDTLFYSGIGRTDLPGGSYAKIQENIRTKLLVLPDNTIVYPGHGPQTTIGQEKNGNPFL